MSKSLEYLDLEIKVENYNLCKRPSSDKHKLFCCFRENYSHRLHSNSNAESFEQLNCIVDLICNFSSHSKNNLERISKSIGQLETSKSENNNFLYIKNILQEIFDKIKEEKFSNDLKVLVSNIKKIETELTETNKLLKKILYG